MIRNIATIAISSALMIGGGLAATATPASAPIVSPWFLDRACPTEDSRNCAHDAETMGNRKGYSFANRNFRLGKKRITCVMYEDRARARKHDTCFRNR